MMRPKLCNTEAAALAWSKSGGIALVLGDAPALFASPAQKSEAVYWARWLVGKVGAVFLDIENRGTDAERCKLEAEQAERLKPYCV
jgi:hypothetical protein